eukprot:NODE_2568_length_673_cov_997.552885_g2108_i0.p2 GENE.NODE_2568_length_673_cov_997.552885_g2108_i0~~NODE_2568_length_673_cov_997.552885_g2108_i0.p2  ORF type:complete len:161 (-),score=52.72 NODE_2568_length_673_cov_997.552885_g2108_i0:135-617(-)
MGSLEKAAELNAKLEGKQFFLGGRNPGDQDRAEFQALLGKDNVHLWRWVKHIASFPEEERKAWVAAAKVGVVGKSSIILDLKPWDDETDLQAMEDCVRGIEITGLHWGASKLVPVAFGIKKLQIMLTIIDDLVSSDDIEDAVMAKEDFVQSMDVVAWNKV